MIYTILWCLIGLICFGFTNGNMRERFTITYDSYDAMEVAILFIHILSGPICIIPTLFFVFHRQDKIRNKYRFSLRLGPETAKSRADAWKREFGYIPDGYKHLTKNSE